MNERIRELAKQAGFNPYNYEGANAALFKKFAELILEDMHRKVIASILITDVVMNEKGQTPTSEDYLLAIHKDFGVEDELVNQMTQKYEFVAGDELKVNGRIVKRIRALIAIPRHKVAIGELGGYIESESNLSHEGDAWVGGNAQVYGNAKVSGRAHVYGNALVSGNALVHGDACVCGKAQVGGISLIGGDAWVGGRAQVSGDEVVN